MVEIKRQVFENRLLCTRHICLCGLFVFAAWALFPKARAQSSRLGTGVDGSGLIVESRSQAGLAQDAGEFYRVDGRKIRLLRSMKKVAVHHAPDRGRVITERLKARQGTGRLFVVEQELAKGRMTIMQSSDMSSLAELDEAMGQIQRESEVDQVTPVYINEATGLEMIPTDEFIVKLAPDATLEQLDALNRRMGITLVRRLRGTTDQFICTLAILHK